MHFSLSSSFNIIFLLTIFGFSVESCNKFEGSQTIPAYLKIDTTTLQTNYYTQGSNTHNITDAWIYVNDQLLGVFELPALLPVLQEGENKLEIRAGIKINGIGATRAPYPFYVPYTLSSFNFIPGSIQLVKPSTKYSDIPVFAWIEDFESAGLSLVSTAHSDTNIYKTTPYNNPEAWLSQNSAFSGMVVLDQGHKNFEIATLSAYVLPRNGAPVILELDYKCDFPFMVGMFASENGSVVSIPLVGVNPSEKWNKIYINLGPNVTDHTQASNFKIYFQSMINQEERATFYFDNIKLIYRPNQS